MAGSQHRKDLGGPHPTTGGGRVHESRKKEFKRWTQGAQGSKIGEGGEVTLVANRQLADHERAAPDQRQRQQPPPLSAAAAAAAATTNHSAEG